MLTDISLMPFGAYRGMLLQDVPASYLLWFYRQDWAEKKYPDLYEYVSDNEEDLIARDREERGDF